MVCDVKTNRILVLGRRAGRLPSQFLRAPSTASRHEGFFNARPLAHALAAESVADKEATG